MDFWAYIANGGLERLLIIGVAALIGYWGYRIYTRSQTPGLALIALAAVVLFSVILTSKQHLQTMNDNLLALGTLESPAMTEPVPVVIEGFAAADGRIIENPETGTADASASAQAPADTSESELAAASPEVDDATTSADTAAEQQETDPATVQRLIPLASGQELGGRITSVRSENLTLEWSDTDKRRIIRPSEKQ